MMGKFKFLSVLLLLLTSLVVYSQQIETVIQTGHYATVTAVACNLANTLVATGSADKTVKLWRLVDGKEIRTLQGSNSEISSIEFSKNGKCLLAVNENGVVLIWDIETGKLIQQFSKTNEKYSCASFHPAGDKIITAGKKSSVAIWDIISGKQTDSIRAIPVKNENSGVFEYSEMRTIAFSSDGQYIIGGSIDKTAILWDATTGKELRKYKKTWSTCSSCLCMAAMSHDNKYVLSANYDSVKVFDRVSGQLVRELYNRKGSFGALTISPDSKYVASIEYGNTVIWDFHNGKLIYQSTDNTNKATSICFSADSKYVVTGSEKRTAQIRNIHDGKVITELKGFLNDLDERILNYSYMYWASFIKETKLSPDGKYIAVGQNGGNALLVDFKTGKIHKTLNGHSKMVLSLSFSNDGKYLATGGIDGKAIIWETETGSQVNTFNYTDQALAMFSVDISPDNKYLAVADWGGYIVIWDIETGKVVRSFSPHGGSACYHIKFSPNGLYIISAGLDKKLKLIEIDTGEEIREFKGHIGLVTSIQLHPSLERFITAGVDNSIRIWDFYSGLQVKKINAHEGGVYSARFDQTGKYIISGGNDNKVKLWDASTGVLLSEFTGHKGGVSDVNMSPDQKYIVSGSRDGSVRVWQVENKKELASLAFLANNDWFVCTPQGYFDASEGAYQSISFVKGTNLYSIDQFFNEFYKPNLYQDAVFNDAVQFRENIFNSIENYPPPSVEIVSPENGMVTDNNMATLLVKITNNGGGLKEFKLLQNGKRQVVDDSDIKRVKKAGQYVMKTIDLKLVPGENLVRLSAFNDGEIESVPATISLNYKGVPKTANCYVFSIGINKYANENLNLNYARPDAEAFSKLMGQKARNLFKNVYEFNLFDGDATREKILAMFDNISRQISKEDVFVFFYAGHGSVVDGMFYFITSESTGLYQSDKMGKAIQVKELQEKFKAISALKQVVFIDACHSGSSVDLLAMRGAEEEKALAQLSRSSGIHVMASSESQQQSAEIKSLGHGVFTYILLQALQGKADGAPKDDKVTVYELKSYIDDQVPEVSFQLIRHKQFPSTFSIGHDFPLVMGDSR